MSCFLKGHLSRDLFLPFVRCQTQERFFFFLPSIMYLKSWNTKKTCRYCCKVRQSGGKCVNNWLHNHVNLFLTFWHFCQSKLSKCCSWSTNTKKYEKNQNAIGKYSNFYPSPPPHFFGFYKVQPNTAMTTCWLVIHNDLSNLLRNFSRKFFLLSFFASLEE